MLSRRRRSASPYLQVTKQGQAVRACDSPLAGSSHCRCLFVRMSGGDVRRDENKTFGSTDPIFYQSMADIFHQTVELLCVPRVVKEVREIISGCHRVHCLANLLQSPGNLCVRLSSRPLAVCAHRSSLLPLSFSLTSPGRISSQSDSESVLILCANDSTARSFTSVS